MNAARGRAVQALRIVLSALLLVPAHALAAPSRAFRDTARRAVDATVVDDHRLAGELYEQAYGKLSDEDRASAAGTDAVLDSIAARTEAFHRNADEASLAAGVQLLERHIELVRRLRPTESTAALDRRLASARALLPSRPAAPIATAAVDGPWHVVIDGVRVGPLDRKMLAEAYLVGDVRDDARIAGPSDRETVPLVSSGVYAALNQWYLGRGSKWLGPMSRDAVVEKIAAGRRDGHDVSRLYVRLEWSSKSVALGGAAPLSATPVAPTTVAAEVSVPPPQVVAPREYERAPSDEDDGARRREDRDDERVPGRRLVIAGYVTGGIGLVFGVVGVVMSKSDKTKDEPKTWGPVLGIGVATLLTSSVLFAAGMVRSRRQRSGRVTFERGVMRF